MATLMRKSASASHTFMVVHHWSFCGSSVRGRQWHRGRQ